VQLGEKPSRPPPQQEQLLPKSEKFELAVVEFSVPNSVPNAEKFQLAVVEFSVVEFPVVEFPVVA
jgi:hypothetical protein